MRFKKYLNEIPLPTGHEPRTYDPKPGVYSSAKIIRAFEKIGTRIGKGSSRIAFKVMVEAPQFNPNILKKYNYHPTNNVETVIKLAINSKGIAQNKAEIENFNNASSSGYERFFLPILDTSARNKGYQFDSEALSNWIQLPVAPPPSKPVFRKMFDTMFGPDATAQFFLLAWRKDGIEDLLSLEPLGTTEQFEEFQDFLSALSEIDLGAGDLIRMPNWGVWNNQLYIIDYGFDSSTENLYKNREHADAWVDSKGNITLNIKQIK